MAAYAAATIVVGTSLAIALESPRFIDRFVVKAEAAQVPDQVQKDQKDGFKRQCLSERWP
jgi:hypothetical protein